MKREFSYQTGVIEFRSKMDRPRCKLGIIFALFLIAGHLSKETSAEREEPTCFSRFDYDMKMLESIVDMKHDQKVLTETVNKLQDLVEKLMTSAAVEQDTLQKLQISRDEQQEKLQNLGHTVGRIEGSTTNGIGSSYIRWGRRTCPSNGTTLIYKGSVGGSHYSQSGSGADYQCLPDDPTWGKFQDGSQGSKSYMYGAEYEPSSLHFDVLAEKEVPCAVCLTTRSTVIMIPARTSCYPGWTLEYEGNLASAYHGHQRSQYICVDKNAESTLASDSRDQNGALLYAVEARCGSLQCPPYVDGRELACVVCSK